MANHKSAEKRNRQSQVRRLRNKANRTRMKTVVRRVDEAVIAGSIDEAQEALKQAIPIIAKVASKGVLHKNKASRKISRLTKRVNGMTAA